MHLKGVLGVGLSKEGKLDGEDYCFEIGASKSFNNLTTSPTKYGKCPYFFLTCQFIFLSAPPFSFSRKEPARVSGTSFTGPT